MLLEAPHRHVRVHSGDETGDGAERDRNRTAKTNNEQAVDMSDHVKLNRSEVQ
jgi:hypothetical protein